MDWAFVHIEHIPQSPFHSRIPPVLHIVELAAAALVHLAQNATLGLL